MSQRKSPVPILSQLPANAAGLEFGALAGSPSKRPSSPYGSPHHGSHLTHSQLMTPVGSPRKNETMSPAKSSPVNCSQNNNNRPVARNVWHSSLTPLTPPPKSPSSRRRLPHHPGLPHHPHLASPGLPHLTSPTTADHLSSPSKRRSSPSPIPARLCGTVEDRTESQQDPSRDCWAVSRTSSVSQDKERTTGLGQDTNKNVWAGSSRNSSEPWTIVTSQKHNSLLWKSARSGGQGPLDLLS